MGVLCNRCLMMNNMICLDKNEVNENFHSLIEKQTGGYVASSNIIIPRRDSVYYKNIYKINNESIKKFYSIEFFKYKYICEPCLYLMVKYKEISEVEREPEEFDENNIDDVFSFFTIDI